MAHAELGDASRPGKRCGDVLVQSGATCGTPGPVSPVDGGVDGVVVVAAGEDPECSIIIVFFNILRNMRNSVSCSLYTHLSWAAGRTGVRGSDLAGRVRIWFSSLLNSCFRLGSVNCLVTQYNLYIPGELRGDGLHDGRVPGGKSVDNWPIIQLLSVSRCCSDWCL